MYTLGSEMSLNQDFTIAKPSPYIHCSSPSCYDLMLSDSFLLIARIGRSPSNNWNLIDHIIVGLV